jgi:hypothetical protein
LRPERHAIAGSPDAVRGFVFLIVFPLTFLANTFVPPDGLPPGLRTLSSWRSR